MREAAAAVICDEQHVFNAHAALARDVDARLVGDDHARLTDGLIGLIEARPLVNLEAYAVAEAVTVSNNLQLKVSGNPSTRVGLNYIRQQYLDLSGIPIGIRRTDTEYCVTLPLL